MNNEFIRLLLIVLLAVVGIVVLPIAMGVLIAVGPIVIFLVLMLFPIVAIGVAIGWFMSKKR